MTRYDLVSARKGRDDKTHWHKVGAAFPSQSGGFSLVFDSLPLPDDQGQVRLMMWEAKPREERQGGGQQRDNGHSGGVRNDSADSDSIPF